MRSTIEAKVARTSRGLAPLLAYVRAAAAYVAASRWAMPLGRIALFAGGLVLLAVIGDSALARAPTALAAAASAAPAVASAPPLSPSSTSDAGATSASTLTPATPAQQALPPPPSPAREGSARGRATPDDPVVLNAASLDEFQRLPGVGPKRARAMFDLRARIGRFRHVEDLLRVKGIGRATLKKLRPLVRLDAAGGAAGIDGGAPST